MKRILLYLVCAISIVSTILLIMCGELPTDPAKEPKNVNATFFIMNSSGTNYQDQAVEIGIIIRYPNLIERVRIVFPDSLLNDTLSSKALQNANYDTLKTTRTFTVSGKKTINIFVDLNDGTVKEFSCVFDITPKQLVVSFDTVPPPSKTIVTGKIDTMIFVASTDPSGGAIDFSVESQPILNASNLKIIDFGSKAMIITTLPSDTTYDITVIAKSGTATENATVKLIAEKKFILHESSSVVAMPSGTSDTITFTIRSSSDTVKNVTLLNTAAFKTGEVEPVVTGKDTFSFVFTPVEAKVYTFSVEITTNNKKDTLSYSISVAKETTMLLKQDTVTISAAEGKVLNVPLTSYLMDTTVQLSSDKGTVNGKFLAYSVPFGNASDTVVITAQKNSDISRIRIYLNISTSDTSKPVITRVVPSDSASITSEPSFTCKVKVADTGAGVKNVVFTVGTVVFIDSSVHTDNIYEFTATNLVQGQKTAIKIRATDKSISKNSDSLIVNITFDSTLTDNVKPEIVLVNPSVDSTKVSSSSLNVEVSCTDKNGISAVTCMLGTTAIAVAKGTGSSFIASVRDMVVGANTLSFTVTDASSKANVTTKSVTIIYDPSMADNVPPVVSIKNPIINGGMVFKDSITVTIACKDDNRIASVTCSHAGAPVTVTRSADSLYSTLIKGLVSGQADTITFIVTDSSTKSNKSTFNVIVKYTTFKVEYFGNGSTGGSVPVDAKSYETLASVTVATAGSLVKTGSSFAGWNTAADGSGTAHVAGSSFTMGSANVMLYAQWTTNPTYTVTYNANTGAGTAPVDINKYETGSTITVLGAGTLVRNGYSFAGWNTTANGSGTARAAGSTFEIGNANVKLYAQWKLIPTFTVTYNGNNNSGGTATTDPGTYVQGATVTVANAGTLVKSGYSFAGWNTEANGSGTAHAAGSTFEMGSTNVTLYAQWQIIRYLVTFKNNVSTATNTEYYDAGSTILSSQYPGFTIGGYELSYWDKTSITVNAPMTVTAYYTALDCSVGGNDIIVWSGTGETFNLIVTPNNSACKITKYTWYTFSAMFYDLSDGTGSAFTASGQGTNKLVVKNVTGGAYGFSCIVSFENGQQDTVKWGIQFKPYVYFNPGDGSGNMDSQQFTPGEAFKLNPCSYTRVGYRFAGWCSGFDCDMGVVFGDQATVTLSNETIYLTANWIEE
jgi:uncharacterized repeat protein (TIGR02543 family)